MLVAPRLETCERVIDEVIGLARTVSLELAERKHPYRTFVSPTGSWLTVRSLDKIKDLGLSIRGMGKWIHGVMVDEGAFVPEWAWKVLRPILVDNNAWLYFTGTTHGEGLFKMLYDWGNDPDRPDYHSFTMPTRSNSFLTEAQIAELEADILPEDRPAELEAQFTARTGLVFTRFSREVHVADVLAGGEMLYGVDWGFTNPAVVLAVRRFEETYQVMDEWYCTGRTPDQHLDAARKMAEKWGPGRFFCDPSRPDMLAAFRRGGLQAVAADNALIPGIDHLRRLLGNYEEVGPRLFISPGCGNLIREMVDYRYSERGGEEPVKEADHAVDSLRYVCYSSRHKVAQAVGFKEYRGRKRKC